MPEEKARKVDVDKFIFQKLYEEMKVIDSDIANLESEKEKTEKQISELRVNLDNAEKGFYSIQDRIKILSENKLLLKERSELIKKDLKP